MKNEYDLYDHLICEPNNGQNVNAACFKKKCNKCRDWEGKIDELLSDSPKWEADEIEWYTWKRSEYTRKNGKKGFCRELVRQKGTFKEFKEELLNDIMKPVERCTFVEHFFC